MTAEDRPPGPVAWSPDRLELGEGARWIDGRLYLVDMLTGRLLVADPEPDRPLRQVFRVDGLLGAVAPLRDRPGSWIVATGPGIAVVDSAGTLEWLDQPEAGNPAPVRMNDGGVDVAGRFWAGSMANEARGAGSLYRVDADGSVVRVLDGISIANGPAFSPDGRWLYLADSAAGTVDRFAIDADSGSLKDRNRFVDIDPGDGAPDGMTVDTDGCLWLALWGGRSVRRYRPDSSLERIVDVPASQPTSVCMGGDSCLDLYITSAAVGLTAPGDGDGAVFRMRADVAGIPAVPAALR